MAGVPTVSVVMPIYNGEQYLKAAIASILNQTFSDFELIALDDGSTDSSLAIIKSFDDSRIRVISRPNKGLTLTLNEGVTAAKGKYIARQDQDDLSEPQRFAIEVAFLESHPEIGLVGSNFIIIDEQARPLDRTAVFIHPDDLKLAEGISNQFGHGSIMMRKQIVEQAGKYDPTVGFVEDYDLFNRIAKLAQIANISTPLYRWRRNPVGISLSNVDEQRRLTYIIRDREFEFFLQHRRQYRLWTSFHPFSFKPNPLRYLDKKAGVFRSLAFLYWSNASDRWHALGMQLCATILSPWRKRNYRYLYWLLTQQMIPSAWEFDSV